MIFRLIRVARKGMLIFPDLKHVFLQYFLTQLQLLEGFTGVNWYRFFLSST